MLHKVDQPFIWVAVGDDTAQNIVVKAIERTAGVSLPDMAGSSSIKAACHMNTACRCAMRAVVLRPSCGGLLPP